MSLNIANAFLHALLLVSAGTQADTPVAPGGTDVALSLGVAERSAIGVETYAQVQVPIRIRAYASVLDVGTLIQATAEIAALDAQASASAAEAARSERLYAAQATVSQKIREAARAAARIDAVRLQAARRRLQLDWGYELVALIEHDAGLLQALVERRASLLRVGLSAEPTTPFSVKLELTGEALQSLGLAATSDPAFAGPSLLMVSHSSGLQLGQVYPVRIESLSTSGQLVPAAAVFADRDGRFVYLQTGPGHFRRHPVRILDEQPDGVLVGDLPPESVIVSVNAAVVHWAALGQAGE